MMRNVVGFIVSECSISENMIRMHVGVYNITDWFVRDRLKCLAGGSTYSSTTSGIHDRDGLSTYNEGDIGDVAAVFSTG